MWILPIPVLPFNARSRVIRVFASWFSCVPVCRWAASFLQYVMVQHYLRADVEVVFCENSDMIDLAYRFGYTIFDCCDYPFGMGEWPKARRKLLTKAFQSDLVISTHPLLTEWISLSYDVTAVTIGNATDLGAYQFSWYPRPVDLPADKPIAIYSGMISHWFDFPWMQRYILGHPELNVVLIGSVHPEHRKDLDRLVLLGAHYLGVKRGEDVVDYLMHSDIGLVPFIRNTLTEMVDACKVYEYLAADLNITATHPAFTNVTLCDWWDRYQQIPFRRFHVDTSL
jgi:hypothetical protein